MDFGIQYALLCPYIAFQLFPKFYTLVPAGILVGFRCCSHVGLQGHLFDAILSSGAHGGGGGDANSTISEEDLQFCGANFCVHGSSGHSNLERPPDHEIFEISMIYLSCIIAAVAIIAFFLDPLKRYGEKRKGSQSAQELSGMELLSATFRQMKKPNQQLLIPITVFIGMEQAFIGADFTQAYVSCALGIHQIGFVMICFGVVNAVCSILFRRNKEAAFSNYRLWESAGFVIAYAYATTLCARMKLYILLAVLTLGCIGYQRKIKKLEKAEKAERRKKMLLLKQLPNQMSMAHRGGETDDELDDLEEDIVVTHFNTIKQTI
ncbi:UNC93-like protein [Eumeta japonica]|uniref:UNC93-like protein n=1 Tax=Eumeta variegata TaxID=151549 RepID=A0A4C2AEL4_EUMVA|nr:UNC93-like protein [Eumeta japonica]